MFQRITIAKLGGVGADIVLNRLSSWSAARNTRDPKFWSPEQWPDRVRHDVDEFVERLREHGFILPVIHFVEWADRWSTVDEFTRWLTPPNCPGPMVVHTNRFEIYAYALPDGGLLARYLAAAGPQQFPETNWFIAHLREVISAFEKLVERAALVVVRQLLDTSTLDEDVTASLRIPPKWLT